MSDSLSVSALAARYDLPADAVPRLTALVDLVAGDPVAPTSVTDRADILRDHLADSLVALDLSSVREARIAADLGAGAGFPGLPLAIALPQMEIHLVESNRRKCEFMTRAAAVCEAANARVVEARAESWTDGMQRCDLVVARALAPLAVVAEYAAPLLRLGGTLIAWRGRRDLTDEAQAARAAGQLGLEPGEPVRVQPYPEAVHRHLHPMVKIAPTPPRFPRRPGMARKRPLN
ncbi:MAG TPA: 16S rRNA (guanine(527)-N(7))-methyltransferase RsmG [Solirubrobacteraceae bacterium]|nr:16S rRNA (guanine(527)-N(7))-methyltransferase RsmG [Solirubrobacteraceae bacterium]